MAKEPDRTRWVGIRPTDPSEDIPTTTRKLAPAISDLQAIKDIYVDWNTSATANCTVAYARDLTVVPAGEIWIVNHICMKNETTFCDLQMLVFKVAVFRDIKIGNSFTPGEAMTWNGIILLKEDEYLRGSFLLGGGVDTVEIYAHGYKIGVY